MDWQSPQFRQHVEAKIEEEIHRSGIPFKKTSKEIENYMFMTANDRDEYMHMLTWFVLDVRGMNACGVGPRVPESNAEPLGYHSLDKLFGIPQMFTTGRPNSRIVWEPLKQFI